MQNGKGRSGAAASDGMSYHIRFLSGPRAGETLPLAGDRVTIGRRKDSTIAIDDGNVSGVHAEITFEEGIPVVRDLGSTNGVFVDGNRIDEMVLSDGDTIRLGQSELRIGAGSPAPSADGTADGGGGDDAADMDAVRVIRDIRPGRRGLGSVVLLVLLLLALGAAGYYYFFLGKKTGMARAVKAAKGNLAAEGWSFESSDGSDGAHVWSTEGNSPRRFTKDFGKARSGGMALKAVLSDGGFAVARRSTPIRVNNRNRYRVSLHAAVQGEVVVSLKAVFFGRGDRSRPDGAGPVPIGGIVDIGCSRNDDGVYHPIEAGLFPPPGAEEMELLIVAAGRGTAHVDDLEIFEDATLKPREEISLAQLRLIPGAGGFDVFRSAGHLMSVGRLQVVRDVPAGGDGDEAPPPEIPSEASGFGDGKGFLFAGAGSGLLAAAHTLERDGTAEAGTGGLAAGLTLGGAGGGGIREILYSFDLAPGYAASGVGLLTADDYVTFDETFPPMPVKGIVFGGPHDRVRVDFDGEARLSGRAGEGGRLAVNLHLEPRADIAVRFTIQCEFTEDEKAAARLLSEAKAAEGNRRYGDALGLIARIEVSYRFIESVYKQAVAVKGRVLLEKKKLLDTIGEDLQSAVFLQNPELFDTLESACRDCLVTFPDDVDFTAQLERIREQSKELRRTIENERAESYYRIVTNLRAAKNRPETAALLVAYMEETFPGSEWTRKAVSGDADEAPPEDNQPEETGLEQKQPEEAQKEDQE